MRTLAVAAVILILIMLTAGWCAARRYSNALTGLWVGDPGFLAEAGLSDLQFYLGPPKPSGDRPCYLFGTDSGGGVSVNDPVSLHFPRTGWFRALWESLRAEGDAYRWHGVAVSDTSVWPETLSVALSQCGGTLTVYDQTKVYAFLEKSPSASAAAEAIEKA